MEGEYHFNTEQAILIEALELYLEKHKDKPNFVAKQLLRNVKNRF